MIAYVTTQGAHIVREGERLIVQSEDARNILFSSKLEQMLLFGIDVFRYRDCVFGINVGINAVLNIVAAGGS